MTYVGRRSNLDKTMLNIECIKVLMKKSNTN